MKTTQSIEDRAFTPVADLFIKTLHVPSIYFDARWPSASKRVDLLVIDRAGVGDVHVVEVKKGVAGAIKAASQLLRIPAQFRWVVCCYEAGDASAGAKAIQHAVKNAPLFADHGPGRVGVITVEFHEDGLHEKTKAEVVVRAERFPGSWYEEADKFTKANRADIMFR